MSRTIPFATDYSPTRRSQILLDFANHINRTKPGSKGALTFEDPEYYVMENIVNDDMAKVGMGAMFKTHRNAQEIADATGIPLEETKHHLEALMDAGAMFWENVDGVDEYWLEVWVTGHM